MHITRAVQEILSQLLANNPSMTNQIIHLILWYYTIIFLIL